MGRFSSRIALVAVGTVLVATGVAGCGGGSDDEEPSGALSKEDYIAQADEICADVYDELGGLEADYSEASEAGDNEAAAEVLRQGTDKVTAAFDELKELTPPEEDQATIDEWLAFSDRQAGITSQLVDAVAEGDEAQIKAVGTRLDDIAAQTDPIADEYGMTECGSAN